MEVDKEQEARFERMRGQFFDVCKKYGYYQQIKSERGLFIFSLLLEASSNKESNESPDRLELARLLLFLIKCQDSEIKLNGTIRKEDKAQISNKLTILHLMNCINKALSDASEGLYEFRFDWDYKKPLTTKTGVIAYCDPHTNEIVYPENAVRITETPFVESYTEEELNTIIEYEKRELAKKRMANRAKFGKELYFVNYKMLEAGIFRGSKFKEYSFLYDYFAILGKGKENFNPDYLKEDSGDVRREKYTEIRYCLDAYDKDQKRKIGDNWQELFDKRMKEHRKLQNLLKRSMGK